MIRGYVVKGSVETGVEVLLERGENIENYPVGALVKIKGSRFDYLGLINNASLTSREEAYRILSSIKLSDRMRKMLLERFQEDLRQQTIEVLLLSKLDRETNIGSRADTLPSFNSPMVDLTEEDARRVFSIEGEHVIEVGVPKQTAHTKVDVRVPVSVERLIDLSFAIYGKSGSGKTFLGNILAMAIADYDLEVSREGGKGVKLLIFDMHSEYGLDLKDNRGVKIADGVAQIFNKYFTVYTPDQDLANKRGIRHFKIPIDKLTRGDIELIAPIFEISNVFIQHLSSIIQILRDTLKLKQLWPLGLVDSSILEKRLSEYEDGKKILARLESNISESGIGGLDVDKISEKAREIIKKKLGGPVAASYASQISKLRRLLDYPLTLSDISNPIDNVVEKLVFKGGSHTVISMGRYENDMPLYMIIANLVARRLREKILELSLDGKEPENKVVIFIEEAHKFLGRGVAQLSPFGEIAREMRKKGIILCVIDQKPGELDPDVISMIWTNFVFNLTDRRDMEQALLGIDKPELFKKIVPTLSPREVLAFGHAVRYPIVLSVRDYKEVEELFKSKLINIDKELKEREEILRESGFI